MPNLVLEFLLVFDLVRDAPNSFGQLESKGVEYDMSGPLVGSRGV
jgi:hypothetical protein